LHARFAIRALLAGVEPQAEQYMTAELTQVKALPETLRTRLESSGIRVSAGKALRMSPEELAENTGLSSHEARRVFTALLGVRRGVRHVTPGQAEPQTRSGDKGRPKRTKQ
jgi:hypothetical protein